MLDPLELLELARALATRTTTPNDAELRKAVSTAYYALFHTALKLSAERFVGSENRGSVAYAVLYRGFAHGKMKEVCNALDKSPLTPKHRKLLRRTHVSSEMRMFARLFVDLQERRQIADYDPQALIGTSDAVNACNDAERAMQALANVDARELTDILALLLVDARA